MTFELSLDSFSYNEAETVDVHGKRVYLIDDDKFYPSITTVLGHTVEVEKKNSLQKWKDAVGAQKAKKICDDACDRGTATHLMLERFLRNEDPKFNEFKDEHVSMFNSLRLAVKRINKIYGQEVVLYSDILGVAGRCDLVAEYQNELAIIDYKTSSRVKSSADITDYWIQAAFYLTAHNEMFNTNITKMVIIMGVENKLPLIFRKTMDNELLLKLAERVSEFYENI